MKVFLFKQLTGKIFRRRNLKVKVVLLIDRLYNSMGSESGWLNIHPVILLIIGARKVILCIAWKESLSVSFRMAMNSF